MPKFDKVKAGDVLYDVRKARCNRNGRKHDTWEVEVMSVDPVKRTAIVRWNHNRPQEYGELSIKQLRWSPPKDRK